MRYSVSAFFCCFVAIFAVSQSDQVSAQQDLAATELIEDQGDFMGEKSSGGFKKEGGCYSYSFNSVSNPSGSGKVIRTTQKSNKRSYCFRGSTNKHRTELAHKNKFGYKKSTWISWKMYVPKDYPSGSTIVSQVMYTGKGTGPDMHLGIWGGKWKFQIKASGKNYDLGSVSKGKWTRWKLNVVRSAGKDGVLKLWKDNKQVISFKGKTTRKSNSPGYFKHGVYWGSESRGSKTYSLYFDDTRIGGKDVPTITKMEPNDTVDQAQNITETMPFDIEGNVNSNGNPVDKYMFSLNQNKVTNIELEYRDPNVAATELDASLLCDSFYTPINSTRNADDNRFESLSAAVPSGVRCVITVFAQATSGDANYTLRVQ